MKLSFAISMQNTAFDAVGKGDWKEISTYMAKMGYDGIEMAIKDPTQLDWLNIRNHLSHIGLKLVAIGTGQAYHDNGYSLIADDVQIRLETVELLKKHIEFAAKFDAIVIIGLIRGKLQEQENPRRAYTNFKENIIEIDLYAQQEGVELVIEPINRYETDYLNTVEETVKIVSKLGLKHTGLLLDTFHMNIEEPKIEQAIISASKYLKHVHIADSNRMHPGRGHINFKTLFEVFEKINYEGYYSGEMLPVPDLETSIRNYYAYLRNGDYYELF